jgi:AraC family transcriptional regulator, regulatory protein of adaptative response / methylated-DNA-[protein]-cysteine methyltransferase
MTTNQRDANMPGLRTMQKAVADRDARFDRKFVYGVVTTGIYCRPSCTSRAAKPQNVRFFAGPSQAETAGLRPCKRCQPDADHSRSTSRIRAIAAYIDEHADEPVSLETLASEAHWSPAHLQRTFKAVLGVSPKAYHDAARLRLLKGSLKAGKSVLESIDGAGFQSTSRVYARGTRNLGMTPSAYRAGGAGETIAYAFRDTILGPLLMAAASRGVCFAQFGTGEAALVAQLKAEFPKATVIPSGNATSPELDD